MHYQVSPRPIVVVCEMRSLTAVPEGAQVSSKTVFAHTGWGLICPKWPVSVLFVSMGPEREKHVLGERTQANLPL